MSMHPGVLRMNRTLALALLIALGMVCSSAQPGWGAAGAQVELRIYDLTGSLVYDSGPLQGRTLQWNLENNAGQLVANGVYLYRVITWDDTGRASYSPTKKLIVLR